MGIVWEWNLLGGQPYVLMGQVTLGTTHNPLTGLCVLGGYRTGQVDQEPELQTDLGGWCCAHRGRQQAGVMGSQSEEEGTAEKLSDPAAAELSLEGGSQGKGRRRGWEGHSTGFFGP